MKTSICGNALRTTTVCMDHYKEDTFVGRFYNPCMKNGEEFRSLMQMILCVPCSHRSNVFIYKLLEKY